jgi:hypothetical protein
MSVTQSQPASTRAVLSLVFAILAFFGLSCIGSIAAIVLGKNEPSGVGRAGYIIGWIGLVLSLVGIAIVIAMMALGIGFAAADH